MRIKRLVGRRWYSCYISFVNIDHPIVKFVCDMSVKFYFDICLKTFAIVLD